ncbi:HAMP domain-containing sensor histidine kinase [Hydrocarboniphaga sp.]|uniref:HAMP domain-containing sensor histidine kinase n=1 Tax=Hydrocarboniphaga sp. TaxID=2033016 RepID=UPI003D1501DE
MKWPAGRLFWKIFAAFCSAMLLFFLFGVGVISLSGVSTPQTDPSWLKLVPFFSGAVVALLFGFAMAWYMARPLHLLSRGLREAAAARFDMRLAPLLGSRRDEIADLAQDFDSMASQLQQALAQQRRLFHDISHELRSPLARIQAAIGLYEQNPKEAPALLERISREASRLNALIEELLTLHKLENGVTGGPRERIDVLELLNAIAEDAAFEANVLGSAVVLHAEGSFVTEIDGELIYRALENVVRNAIKYTRPGTSVEIDARIVVQAGDRETRQRLEVRVSDRGPGVPIEQCEAIFEPFRRIESTSRDMTAGLGLGLAIARHAIVLHGGLIQAEPRAEGGLSVSISLPMSA